MTRMAAKKATAERVTPRAYEDTVAKLTPEQRAFWDSTPRGAKKMAAAAPKRAELHKKRPPKGAQ